MMREIKFKIFDGEKITGPYFLHDKELYFSASLEETNLQYTGLKDCEGNEIYEFDEVEYKGIKYVVKYSIHGEWYVGSFRFSDIYDKCKVIGNFYGSGD